MNYQEQLKELIGIPYLSKGRDAAIGLDCWGMVRHASRELFHVEVPDYTGYADANDSRQTAILFECRHAWLHIDKGEEQLGDVVLLCLAGHPIHAGIVVADHMFLHSLKGRNSCLERIDCFSPWFKRWEGVYRWETI